MKGGTRNTLLLRLKLKTSSEAGWGQGGKEAARPAATAGSQGTAGRSGEGRAAPLGPRRRRRSGGEAREANAGGHRYSSDVYEDLLGAEERGRDSGQTSGRT